MAEENENASVLRVHKALALATPRGEVRCRLYRPDPAEGGESPGPDQRAPGRAVLWLGGIGGDWDSPARDLYGRLGAELSGDGVVGLRIRYRQPGELKECVFDAMAGLRFLESRGHRSLAIVGHSFGAAVAIQAAANVNSVRAVAALAPQGQGTDRAGELGPRVALLIIHGKGDEILPWTISEDMHARAMEPKRLITFAGAGHDLEQVADRVHRELKGWLLARL